MGRPYTGFDTVAPGKRAGFETFIDLLEAHFGLWNNGTFGVRKKRGKSSYSVHATGRAGDLSWRGAPYRGPGNYEAACKMMDFLAANADVLHVEAIFDYYPAPYGRGWKCDRAAWQVYSKKAFSGAPSGDWVHVEVSNAKADDAQYYIDTMKRLLGDPPVAVKPAPAKATPKAPPGKKPWYQVGSKGAGVKKVQEIVGAKPVDGSYGPKTAAAVKAWQAEHDQHVDGVWGPGSDKHAKNCDCKPAEPAPEPISSVKIGDDKKAAPKFTETIRRGSRGEHVKPVQEKVGAKQDGWFGPGTERRVKEWQKDNGLLADGIVGPKTFAAMFG
jgi:peptidoglycan hydrolase-like protein with peptidoglycan-binding domain